ncbi:DUF4381 family protein [Desulfopila sp. IMCC35006]|uniref:DUF4381 family protein n=1 Tax=Desulfopila sp. IMCC35006 TaxID=2569542 RepID=UPI0010AC3A95|nr:DUF4381 family protein [Desulfopila sp. IMCC35006]TKB24283.1 DUF4381 family protein [Desulfopila sp. IMCC35006]
MTGRIAILLLLVFFALPVVTFADSSASNAAPLTLLQQPGKNAQTAQTPNTAKEDNELRDIQGPVPLIEQPPYLLLAGIILALLAAGAALYWFINRRTRPAPPPVPPWEKALQELAEAKRLLSPERALLYMDRVSQILRRYIEARFAIKSTRQTTGEFLQGLADTGSNSLLQRHKSELQLCLEQADMAKFAHHAQDIHSLEIIEGAVITFIKKTEPAEPQEPEKPVHQRKSSKKPKRGSA